MGITRRERNEVGSETARKPFEMRVLVMVDKAVCDSLANLHNLIKFLDNLFFTDLL